MWKMRLWIKQGLLWVKHHRWTRGNDVKLYLAYTISTYHLTTHWMMHQKPVILTSERRYEIPFIVSYRKRNTYSIFDTLVLVDQKKEKLIGWAYLFKRSEWHWLEVNSLKNLIFLYCPFLTNMQYHAITYFTRIWFWVVCKVNNFWVDFREYPLKSKSKKQES